MKPMNFPVRKLQRRLAALKRFKRPVCQELLTLTERCAMTLEQARGIRTKKYRTR